MVNTQWRGLAAWQGLRKHSGTIRFGFSEILQVSDNGAQIIEKEQFTPSMLLTYLAYAQTRCYDAKYADGRTRMCPIGEDLPNTAMTARILSVSWRQPCH